MRPRVSSLQAFEKFRNKRNWIPPLNSNIFPEVIHDDVVSNIRVVTIRTDPNDFRFNLFTNRGTVHTGTFTVSGDIVDTNNPYNNLTVIQNSGLIIDEKLAIDGGNLNVHGTLELLSESSLIVGANGTVTLFADSVLIINKDSKFSITSGGSMTIYGRIDIHYDLLYILEAYNIYIDPSVTMNVHGIPHEDPDLGPRVFSLTDYLSELNQRFVNRHVRGDKSFQAGVQTGRVGFVWRYGDPIQPSHILGIELKAGRIPLGDFDFSVLGRPINVVPDMQLVQDLEIRRGTSLYISERFDVYDANGNSHYYQYSRPRLRIGRVIENNEIPNRPGSCIVHGKIICAGHNASIDIDRGATLYIMETGELHLKRKAEMRCGHADGREVLYILGKLVIDDIDQIKTFDRNNIVLGPDAKIIIKNPSEKNKRILFSTPKGIREKDTKDEYKFGVYRLFYNDLDKVEYHISKNCGIKIDATEAEVGGNYSHHMIDWYAGMRLEKAVHEGLIIWDDEAFIELNSTITPWISETFEKQYLCEDNDKLFNSIIPMAQLFKSFGSFPEYRIRDTASRLRYAGFNKIMFRFIHGSEEGIGILNLESINMISNRNDPAISKFVLRADNDGTLFIRNMVPDKTPSSLIHIASRKFDVEENNGRYESLFTLP